MYTYIKMICIHIYIYIYISVVLIKRLILTNSCRYSGTNSWWRRVSWVAEVQQEATTMASNEPKADSLKTENITTVVSAVTWRRVICFLQSIRNIQNMNNVMKISIQRWYFKKYGVLNVSIFCFENVGCLEICVLYCWCGFY